jgi:hypothetical protein
MSKESFQIPLSDLTVHVMDEATHGGAHHEYEVHDADGNVVGKVSFQNGPIKEHGVNGVTHEAVLAIVAHRLRSFQSGPYACDENRTALDHIERANEILYDRTRKRLARGVEGTRQL